MRKKYLESAPLVPRVPWFMESGALGVAMTASFLSVKPLTTLVQLAGVVAVAIGATVRLIVATRRAASIFPRLFMLLVYPLGLCACLPGVGHPDRSGAGFPSPPKETNNEYTQVRKALRSHDFLGCQQAGKGCEKP